MRPPSVNTWVRTAVAAVSLVAVSGCASTRPTTGHSGPEVGMASYYGDAHQGRRTANGERFDMHALTAAHRTLPFGTRVEVTNLENGRSVVVRINDRGPFLADRIIDLSYAAAYKLGYVNAGSAKVEVEAILPGKRAAAGEHPPV